MAVATVEAGRGAVGNAKEEAETTWATAVGTAEEVMEAVGTEI